MMKPVSWLSLVLIPVFVLAGCASVSPTIRPTQKVQIPSPTSLPVMDTVVPTSMPTMAITETPSPTSTPTLEITETSSPTATQTLLATLRPESVKETMQPFLKDPMNCANPCFLGITPRKTRTDEVRALFSPLGLKHREGTDPNSGRDFYSFAYETSAGLDSHVILYTSNNFVENIEITPEITRQTDGSPRQWIAFSFETLIKKFGKPSRVEFAFDPGQGNITVNMILYFDPIDLIALYSGYEPPHSSQLCPFTFPFSDVRLWMGAGPLNPPTFPTVPLEMATSLTVDQFTQLMLGDPKNACFTLNWDVFNR
jgi:hypothetical protein